MTALALPAWDTSSADADPVPFSIATASCSPGRDAFLTFPAATISHPDAVYSITSSGASGQPPPQYLGDGAFFEPSFHPADEIWGPAGAAAAGTSPTIDVSFCTSGTITGQLYNRPVTPATISGISTGSGTVSDFPFIATGSGQYVLDSALDEGALKLQWVDSTDNSHSMTIASSGETPLGSLGSGDQDILVNGVSGPVAHYRLTVRELPVAISGLSLAQRYAAPGTILTAPFSVSGDTTISANVLNAAGQVARHLGTFAVKEGSSAITWDTRDDGGSNPPDGTYTLVLVSTDANGDASRASAPAIVDATPPSVAMTSPKTIRPTQSVSFSVTDAGSGTARAEISIDGRDVGDYSGSGKPLPPNGQITVSPPYGGWDLGSNTWKLAVADHLGNKATVSGAFRAANPPPPTATSASAAFDRRLPAGAYVPLSEGLPCPTVELSAILRSEASCFSEYRLTTRWALAEGGVTTKSGSLDGTIRHTGTWVRRWQVCREHGWRVLGTNLYVPGARRNTLVSNNDCGREAPQSDAYFVEQEMIYGCGRRSRPNHGNCRVGAKEVGWQFTESAGFESVGLFRCKHQRQTFTCTNAVGDSFKYTS